MAKLEIDLSTHVNAGRPETVLVRIEGAPAGATVQVTLVQVQGRVPFWGPETQETEADGTGAAFATFSVSFRGPTPTATVRASAVDADATFYEPVARHAEVLP